MEAAFRAHSLWAGCSEEELDSAGEVSIALPYITSLYIVIYCGMKKVSYCDMWFLCRKMLHVEYYKQIVCPV